MKNLLFLFLFSNSTVFCFAQNIPFHLVVYDKMNREPIAGAIVKMQDMSSPRQYNAVAGEDGSVDISLAPADRYRLEVSTKDDGSGTGYLNYTYTLSHKEINEKKAFTADLEKVKHNGSGLVPAMHFVYNNPGLSEENQAALNNVLAMVKGFPSLQIEIGVYADCHENEVLVTRRAAAIKEYLVAKGESSHITVKEYGNIRALNHCNCSNTNSCNEEKYAENRRAEFKVISF